MKLSHGVAAGAEDSKYQAKYKDLKKKVKELEAVSISTLFFHILSTCPARTMIDFISKYLKLGKTLLG